MTILIKNGLIVDGTKKLPYKGNILIENQKIVSVGNFNLLNKADREIDAEGLVISPGFIDTHSHSDLKILEIPHNEVKARQGITTEVLGQDGISMAPLPEEYITPWKKNLAGLDGTSEIIDWNYKTTDGYLKLMEKQGVGLNYAYLVPHGNVRMEAMGLEGVPASKDQIEKMCEITRREMEAGAYGLSTGLIYIPCAYSETEELIEMCKIVAEYDGMLVIHQRSEAGTIIESMEEVLEIGRKSGVKIHFSHFKVCGKQNWKYIDDVIALLDKAKENGVKISYDQYPYAAGSTMLGVVLPPWAHDGGTDNLLERLRDPIQREKMRYDIENGIYGWDNFIEFAGFNQIFVTSVQTSKNESLIGKNLIEISEIRGTNPYDSTFDLLLEEENAVGMVDFYGLEEHVIKFLKREEQNVCTDALLSGKPHPRAYGSFPRVIGKYVRETPILSLEEAIYKMTKKAAEAMGITSRGELKEGMFADITIFNLDTIIDVGDYINPKQFPIGVHYLLVNGELIIDDGDFKNNTPGKVLRKGRGIFECTF